MTMMQYPQLIMVANYKSLIDGSWPWVIQRLHIASTMIHIDTNSATDKQQALENDQWSNCNLGIRCEAETWKVGFSWICFLVIGCLLFVCLLCWFCLWYNIHFLFLDVLSLKMWCVSPFALLFLCSFDQSVRFFFRVVWTWMSSFTIEKPPRKPRWFSWHLSRNGLECLTMAMLGDSSWTITHQPSK